MNILTEIIQGLTTQETRFYKIFTNRTHNKRSRKDLGLFKLIKEKKENYDEEKACADLSEGNKNNFYQLKNKLAETINKSLVLQYSNSDKETLIADFMLISRIYKRKGNLKLSFHYLKKAEKEALNIEDFELASKIYTNILKLSYDLISIDAQEYIKKKSDNQKKMQLAQDTDIALASVMYKIKTTQNFSGENKGLIKTLNNTLNSLRASKDIANSQTFRINVAKVVSRVLLQKNDFIALEEYLKIILQEFKKDKIFNKKNHEEKLMLLTYLTNCLYKNKKFKEALRVAEQLMSAMNEYDSILKDKYLFYYYNTLVINYSEIDKGKAIEVLLEAKNNKTIQNLPTFGVFIYLNRALIEYHQKKYKSAIKSISRLILQEDFVNLADLFQLKICIAELMIRYKLSQTDLIESKIQKINKVYKKHLQLEKRDTKILLIISKLIYCKNLYVDTKLKQQIQELIKETSDESATNTDIINYNEWLRSLKK